MDISLQPTRTYTAENRSWLGSAHGTDVPQTVTLKNSLFIAATHYPDGYVPSGCVLGIVTASGLYGPYDDTAVDGRAVARGFLYSSTKLIAGGADVGAPIHWHGAVKKLKLPFQTGTGSLDAAGIVDLAAKFWIM